MKKGGIADQKGQGNPVRASQAPRDDDEVEVDLQGDVQAYGSNRMQSSMSNKANQRKSITKQGPLKMSSTHDIEITTPADLESPFSIADYVPVSIKDGWRRLWIPLDFLEALLERLEIGVPQAEVILSHAIDEAKQAMDKATVAMNGAIGEGGGGFDSKNLLHVRDAAMVFSLRRMVHPFVDAVQSKTTYLLLDASEIGQKHMLRQVQRTFELFGAKNPARLTEAYNAKLMQLSRWIANKENHALLLLLLFCLFGLVYLLFYILERPRGERRFVTVDRTGSKTAAYSPGLVSAFKERALSSLATDGSDNLGGGEGRHIDDEIHHELQQTIDASVAARLFSEATTDERNSPSFYGKIFGGNVDSEGKNMPRSTSSSLSHPSLHTANERHSGTLGSNGDTVKDTKLAAENGNDGKSGNQSVHNSSGKKASQKSRRRSSDHMTAFSSYQDPDSPAPSCMTSPGSIASTAGDEPGWSHGLTDAEIEAGVRFCKPSSLVGWRVAIRMKGHDDGKFHILSGTAKKITGVVMGHKKSFLYRQSVFKVLVEMVDDVPVNEGHKETMEISLRREYKTHGHPFIALEFAGAKSNLMKFSGKGGSSKERLAVNSPIDSSDSGIGTNIDASHARPSVTSDPKAHKVI